MQALAERPDPLAVPQARIEPPNPRRPDSAMSTLSLNTLSAMGPCADSEAEILRPCLSLTEADQRRLAELSAFVKLKFAAFVEAEASASETRRLAAQVPLLERRMGESAARAMKGGSIEKQALQQAVEALDEARMAAAAVKPMDEAAAAAASAWSAAKWALRKETQAALTQSAMRASLAYSQAAAQATAAAAALTCAIGMLEPVEREKYSQYHHGVFIAQLRMPTPVQGLRPKGVAEGSSNQNHVDMLVSPEHPRYLGQARAHDHLVKQQIASATADSGLTLSQVLA